jgi:hypothetical protein
MFFPDLHFWISNKRAKSLDAHLWHAHIAEAKQSVLEAGTMAFLSMALSFRESRLALMLFRMTNQMTGRFHQSAVQYSTLTPPPPASVSLHFAHRGYIWTPHDIRFPHFLRLDSAEIHNQRQTGNNET